MEKGTHKKIAVVTGAFGYVGFSVCQALQAEGWNIALLYHTTDPLVLDNKLAELGEGKKAYQCDVRDKEAIEATLAKIETDLGPIVLSVHASGRKPERKKLLQTSKSDLDSQIEDTFVASFNFLTASGARLKANGGGVLVGITTAAVVFEEAATSLGAYIPAKFAVQGMLAMLKNELSLSGVRVYSIAPGFMRGGMNADIPKAFADIVESKSGRLTSAQDIATTIVALTKDASAHTELTIPLAPEYE